MPSLFKMADDKNTTSETPVVITQMATETPKPRNTKKYVIIAISVILAIAIILAAILVGIYMFTEAQKDLLEYTIDVDKDTKEDVTTDQNENVIQYHVRNAKYEVWVVDDFNRDLEVMKIQTETETNCYVVPLNRTTATDPSKIKSTSNVPVKENYTDSLTYDVADTPISTTIFLAKKAKEMCKGISVYWLYPRCTDEPNPLEREKRAVCYYCYYYYYYCLLIFTCSREVCNYYTC